MPSGSPKDIPVVSGPWPRGLLSTLSERTTPHDGLREALNVEIGVGGDIRRRDGFSELKKPTDAYKTGPYPIEFFLSLGGRSVHQALWHPDGGAGTADGVTLKQMLVGEDGGLEDTALTTTFNVEKGLVSPVSNWETPVSFVDTGNGVVYAACNRQVKVRDAATGAWIDLPSGETTDDSDSPNTPLSLIHI